MEQSDQGNDNQELISIFNHKNNKNFVDYYLFTQRDLIKAKTKMNERRKQPPNLGDSSLFTKESKGIFEYSASIDNKIKMFETLEKWVKEDENSYHGSFARKLIETIPHHTNIDQDLKNRIQDLKNRIQQADTCSSPDANQPVQDQELRDMLDNPILQEFFTQRKFQLHDFSRCYYLGTPSNAVNEYKQFLNDKNTIFQYCWEIPENIKMFHTLLTWIKSTNPHHRQFANNLCNFLLSKDSANQLQPFINHARNEYAQSVSQASQFSHLAESSTQKDSSPELSISLSDFDAD